EERRAGSRDSDNQQRSDGLIGGFKDGRYYRARSQRTTRDWTIRKRAVAQLNLDLFKWDAGLVRRELGQNRVSTGADVLRRTGNANGAIVAQLYVSLSCESSCDPCRPRHAPSQRQSVSLHRANSRVAF